MSSSAICYHPSGNRISDDQASFVPCNNTAIENGDHSACCQVGDLCLTNGLCKASNSDWNRNWRIGCTDETFKDPACPSYCLGVPDQSSEDPDDRNHLIFQCQDGDTFCCSTGDVGAFDQAVNYTCCDKPEMTFKAEAAVYTTADFRITLSTLSTSAVATSSPIWKSSISSAAAASGATTSQARLTDSQLAGSSGSSSLSTAAKVGIGIAVPLALIFMGLLCYSFWRVGQKHGRRDVRAEICDNATYLRTSAPMYPMELDTQRRMAEIGYGERPVELGTQRFSMQTKKEGSDDDLERDS